MQLTYLNIKNKKRNRDHFPFDLTSDGQGLGNAIGALATQPELITSVRPSLYVLLESHDLTEKALGFGGKIG